MVFSSADTLSFTLVTHTALSHQARLSGMSCGCSLLQCNCIFYCFRGKNSMSSCSPATLPRADCSQSGSQLWGCREMLIVPLCCSTAFSTSGHRCETSFLASIKLWAPPRWGLDHFSVKAEIQYLLMPEKKCERFIDPGKSVSLVQNDLKYFIPPSIQVKEKHSWRQQVMHVLKQFL